MHVHVSWANCYSVTTSRTSYLHELEVDVGPKLNAYQHEACISWKWQNYHGVLLAVLNAQWREEFEGVVTARFQIVEHRDRDPVEG
jgi:hypothetical protein